MEPWHYGSCQKTQIYIMETIRYIDAACYHAAPFFMHHLEEEIPEPYRRDGELLTVLGETRKAYWVRNIWKKPFIAEFDSINDAAKILRAIQRNWAVYPFRLARRASLIAKALPRLPSKPKVFPFELPDNPMGAYTLLDENHLMASAICSSPWPNGELVFEEDREEAPSRAYRKLWEAFLLAGSMPQPGEHCLDAGASPGGWSWALARLGARVTAIDRAELDSRIAALPQISFIKHNAFSMDPKELGPVDWLFSDIICYPPKLYEWVCKWLESGLCKNFICTIKMQGNSWDKETVQRFAEIPGSKIEHLWHNKHELSWVLVQN